MSVSNGVIRIGRKGLKKFAFGEEGEPFEVDVVQVFQRWLIIDDEFRVVSDDRIVSTADMPRYHKSAQGFVKEVSGSDVTVAEALDFIARLREQWDTLVDFFHPKLPQERDLPDTSEVELRFSVEEAPPS